MGGLRACRLVPKFHLGTQSLLKVDFLFRAGTSGVFRHAPKVAKWNFADNSIPKWNLGTREKGNLVTPSSRAQRSELGVKTRLLQTGLLHFVRNDKYN